MSQIQKERRGLLVSAAVVGGTVRVTIDDVISKHDEPNIWTPADHVTSKEISRDSLSTMTFDEKEMADFAFFLLARLSAFADRNEL